MCGAVLVQLHPALHKLRIVRDQLLSFLFAQQIGGSRARSILARLVIHELRYLLHFLEQIVVGPHWPLNLVPRVAAERGVPGTYAAHPIDVRGNLARDWIATRVVQDLTVVHLLLRIAEQRAESALFHALQSNSECEHDVAVTHEHHSEARTRFAQLRQHAIHAQTRIGEGLTARGRPAQRGGSVEYYTTSPIAPPPHVPVECIARTLV